MARPNHKNGTEPGKHRDRYKSFLIFGVIFLVPGIALSLYNSEPLMGNALVVLGVIFTSAGLIGTVLKKLKRA